MRIRVCEIAVYCFNRYNSYQKQKKANFFCKFSIEQGLITDEGLPRERFTESRSRLEEMYMAIQIRKAQRS